MSRSHYLSHAQTGMAQITTIFLDKSMYTLLTAFAKNSSVGKSWAEVDLSQTTIAEMQNLYDKIYLHVENSFTPGVTKRIDWCDVRTQVVDISVTLNAFFAINGNRTLPTYDTLVKLKTGVVSYSDAFQAGYSIDVINRSFAPGSVNSDKDARDVYLKKPGVDPMDFFNHCLVVVNDLFHLVDATQDEIYVAEATHTARRSGRSEMGIINFKNVSKITCIPLTEQMLFKEKETDSMGDRFYVKVPPVASGKLVGIVLGGYIHLRNPDVWWSISDDVFAFSPRNIPLVDRIMESEDIIDLSSLGLDRAGRNKKQLSKEQLFSDEVIKRYATLPQSFLVVFDNPEVLVEHIAVQKTTLPGMYLFPSRPTLPLMYKKGMIAAYRWKQDVNMYAIRTSVNYYNHYLADTTTRAVNPADNRVPHDPRKTSHATLWSVNTTTVEFE